MNARPRVWAAAAAAALCAAVTVTPLRAAQAQVSADSAASVTAAVATPAVEQPTAHPGPTLSSASVAVRAVDQQRVATSSGPTNAMPARNSQGQPKALMIVGGAAFIAGALIGDTAGTAIMIGGAGIGLYGLYLYLQ